MRLSKYFSMYARTCQAISETTSQTPRQINYEAGFKSMKAHARSNDKIALWVFNFLKNETNMPDYVLNYVLMHHAKFIYNHPEQFMRNIKLLPEYGMDEVSNSDHWELMCEPHSLFLNKLLLLKESGGQCNLDAKKIIQLKHKLTQSIAVWKRSYSIPNEASLTDNWISHFKFGSNCIKPEVNFDDNDIVKKAYVECVVKCFKLKLKMTEDEVTAFRKIVSDVKSNTLKSFYLMSEMVDIMRDDLNLSNILILRLWPTLNCDPTRLKELLEKNPKEMHNLEMKKLIMLNPILIKTDPDSIMKNLQLLKDYDISNEKIKMTPVVLGINPRDLAIRMKYIMNHEKLLALLPHKNFLNLCINISATMTRLSQIESSISTTRIAAPKRYKRFLDGLDYSRQRKRCLIGVVLKKELNLDKEEVKQSFRYIKRHPHYRFVPRDSATKTLSTLKNKFAVENILKNVHIILYPMANVDAALEQVREKYGNKLDPSRELAMTLYELEVGYHFTGDGIWPEELTQIEKDQLQHKTEERHKQIDLETKRITAIYL